jgi:hypothetical protein
MAVMMAVAPLIMAVASVMMAVMTAMEAEEHRGRRRIVVTMRRPRFRHGHCHATGQGKGGNQPGNRALHGFSSGLAGSIL